MGRSVIVSESRSTGPLLALAQSYQRLSCRTAIDIVLQLVPPAAQSILDPVFHSLHRTIMPGSIEGQSIRLKAHALQSSAERDHNPLQAHTCRHLRVRRGPPPEDRDFVRIKFKNGTRGDFETYHTFGHKSDIAATEFIYRIENYIIASQKQWAAACSLGLTDDWVHNGSQNAISSTVFAILVAVFLFLFGMFILSKFIKSARAKARNTRIRLADDEGQYPDYGTLSNVGPGIVPVLTK
ncbi:hypothetical protein F4604DRAFT_1687666 [Suillus subluteus]|nr:hypothetical protein F4604DRAFT_1687666 [Suillus subluteus]